MDGSPAAPGNILTLQRLPGGAERYFDGSRPVTIGRDTAADVVVLDGTASLQHAVLRLEGAGWVFEDRGSAYGSFLDGRRVTRLPVDRPMILGLGPGAGGSRIRLVPPAPSGELDSDIPTMPVFTDGLRPPGTFRGTYRASTRIRIGRASDNDIVVDDLLVSRHHAELREARDGSFELLDLGSQNGTYVDGRWVAGRTRLREGALVAVGDTLLRLQHGTLEEYVDHGEVTFCALGLTVNVGDRVLLDRVSFALEGGQFLAVLGPTGAGKSTLLRALTGARPADRGSVLYNGRDLYSSYAELRNRIGYVPQDDVLHLELTVKAALDYAARLRFPPDVPAEERSARVVEVMTELGLDDRAGVRVEKLSGGQRKRTSVAIELLTRPSLLILDEPTSGLDPGYEESVMELLRDLATSGRTVITVTHSIQSLELCDRILFLAPGGQTAYFGPPELALPYFEQPGYAGVFRHLDRAAPGRAKEEFSASTVHRRYVEQPLDAQRDRAQQAAVPEAPRRNPHPWHQLSTLMSRYLSLIGADKRNTLLLLVQAPVLGLLMLATFGTDNLVRGTNATPANSTTVLFALVLAASYLGAANSIREIVKERPILTRERSVGQSTAAYILSKVLILGVVTVAESFVLTYLALLEQGGPAHGVVLHSGRLEVAITVSLAGLSALALGLMVSALSSNADKVMTVLPIILFAQFVLSGSAFPVHGTAGLDQIAYLSSARWGYSAEAASANLDDVLGDGCNGQRMSLAGSALHVRCDPAHAPKQSAWAQDIGLLSGLTLLELVGAGLAIRPIGRPGRRPRRARRGRTNRRTRRVHRSGA